MRIRLLWGVLAVATGIAWTSWAGGVPAVPLLPVLAYWGAWAWAVVGPGMLVHRWVRGRPATMVGDVALGACTGLVLQLAAWAAMTTLGWQRHLLWWPALVVLLFASVPRLRRHFSLRAYEQRVPTGAAALGMTAFVVTMRGVNLSFRDLALPPQAMAWYQDDLWNLGNVAELMRTAAPQVAQVAGRPFHYHWFSDAHLAAMSLTTSIDPVTVVGRLWAPPMLLVIVGAAMAVGQRLSGSAWVGAGAAWCFAVAPSIEVSRWLAPVGGSANAVSSPSQVFAVPLTLLGIDLVVSIVRRSHRPRTWALLTATLVACAGAKSSVLPVLFGGLALASLVAVFVARRDVRRLVSMAGLTLLVVLLTQARLAGGESGSRLEPFATLKAALPWRLIHQQSSTGAGGPNGLPSGSGWVLLLLLAGYLVSYLWMAAGAGALRRTDLAGWFLLGTGLAGLLGLLTIRHPAYSQVYFLKIGIVAWQLLALWGYQRAIRTAGDHTGGRSTLRSVGVGVLTGAVLVALARLAGRSLPSVPSVSGVSSTLGRSLLVAAAAVVLAVAVVLLARRRLSRSGRSLVVVGLASAGLCAAFVVPAGRALAAFRVGPKAAIAVAVAALVVAVVLGALRWRRGTASRALTGVLVGLCLLTVVIQSVDVTRPSRHRAPPADLETADEVAAARWVGRAAGQFDVIATNVHCLPTPTTPDCDARAFWVSGLSGRRVLVEGWGYTDAAQAANGRDGLRFSRQPFDNPALLALNDGVFTDPTPEKAKRLYALGVRWLLADRQAGPVSPALAAVASPQFRSGPVTVYRLTSPGTASPTRQPAFFGTGTSTASRTSRPSATA